MTYQELQDIGQDIGIRGLLNFPNLDTPIFYPLILFSIFSIITMSTFFRELRRERRANMLSSLAVGGYVTTGIAFALTLLSLIQIEIVIVTLVISIIFQVIFMLTKRE